MKIENINKYKHVQKIARKVLVEIQELIRPDSTEETISNDCIILLNKYGIHKTWYYSCPALILLGSRSCVSISGRHYQPSAEKVGCKNLITIDLSPLDGMVWGDCARSFVVEDGKIKCNKNEIKNMEFREGIEIEIKLHEHFINYVKSGMTFEHVYEEMNKFINNLCFENLDFMKNVGHTIEIDKEKRLYFEKGNNKKIGKNMFFTFEPHVRKINGKWGFKHENIYYFGNNKVIEL